MLKKSFSTAIKGKKFVYPEPKPYVERHIKSAILDTNIWNSMEMRDDDIIIATPAKAGTTWTVCAIYYMFYFDYILCLLISIN